jgi:hypothetical protein
VSHLPYIIASYALGVVVPGTFALAALLRTRAARRRLAAIDPRVRRAEASRHTASRHIAGRRAE